jgi:hypothetical protein
MSQGFDPFRIYLLEVVDIVEDGAELTGHDLELGFTKFQSGEMSHPTDIVGREGHRVFSPAIPRIAAKLRQC